MKYLTACSNSSNDIEYLLHCSLERIVLIEAYDFSKPTKSYCSCTTVLIRNSINADGFLLQFDALQSYQANHPDWAEHRLGSREFCADRLRQILDCHEEVSHLVRDRHQVLREELGSVHNSARLRQAYK